MDTAQLAFTFVGGLAAIWAIIALFVFLIGGGIK